MLIHENCAKEFRAEASAAASRTSEKRRRKRNQLQELRDQERKYHEQMKLVADDVECGVSASSRQRGDGNSEDSPWPKKQLRHGEIANFSPGSNSDITTEYMAESSKSSSFDEAYTLGLDPASGGATTTAAAGGESPASTTELLTPSRNEDIAITTRLVDLNDNPQAEAAAAAADVKKTAAWGTFVGQERGGEARGERQLMSLLLGGDDHDERKVESEVQRRITRSRSSELQDWLQLGLSPCSTATPVTPTRPQTPAAENVEDEGSDVEKRMLRLFPSEPDHGQPMRMPVSSPPGWLSRANASQYRNQVGENNGTKYGLRVGALEVDEYSRQQQQRQQEGLTAFLKSMQQQYPQPALPGSQLFVSYDAAVHQQAQGSQTQRLSMLSDLPEQPHPYHSSMLLPLPAETLQLQQQQQQQGVGSAYGLSEGNFPSFQPFEDKQYFGRGYMGRRTQLDLPSWRQEGGFHSYPAAPQQAVPPPPALYSTRNQAEDWQALVKKLGGSLHFESLYKGIEGVGELQTRHGSSNLHDLQSQWSIQDLRGGLPSWAGNRGQESSSRRTPFGLEIPVASTLNPGVAPVAQGWRRSDPNLPYHPIAQNQYGTAGPAAAGEQSLKDKPIKLSMTSAGSKEQDLWFFLRAAVTNQDVEQLPQIRKGYLRVKDGTVPVSYVKKYLAHKLCLLSESEVEVSCRGQVLAPGMSLQHVRDVIWHSAAAEEAAGTVILPRPHQQQQHQQEHSQQLQQQQHQHHQQQQQHTAKNIVMELTYKREPTAAINKNNTAGR